MSRNAYIDRRIKVIAVVPSSGWVQREVSHLPCTPLPDIATVMPPGRARGVASFFPFPASIARALVRIEHAISTFFGRPPARQETTGR